jgi:phage head maturation protease
MDHERRILGSHFTLRNSGGAPILVGHAAVFDRDSELIAGSFIERIAPGAFRETIARKDDVRALINHDSNLIWRGPSAEHYYCEKINTACTSRLIHPRPATP